MALRTGEEISMLAAKIMLDLANDEVDFPDAMTALSISLVMSAKQMRVKKEDFIRTLSVRWDKFSGSNTQSRH